MISETYAPELIPSASAPTIVKLRLLAKMTMLMMSSCTIIGVPRMTVTYTLHTAFSTPRMGLRWWGFCWAWPTRIIATMAPSSTPSTSAMAVTSRVVPTPLIYCCQRSE